MSKKSKPKRALKFVVISLTNRNVFQNEKDAVAHASNIVKSNHEKRYGVTELVVVKVTKLVRVRPVPVEVITQSV